MSSNFGPTRLAVALLALAGLMVLPYPAQTQCLFDASKTPVDPPPSNLWNRLEPAYEEGGILDCEGQGYPGNGPSCEGRDTTWFSTSNSPWMGTPWWESIDIEAGYAFLATNLGFQIWDVEGGSNPENPDRLSYPDIRTFSPTPLPGGHGWYLTRDMDADSTGNLAAITGLKLGMLIVDTSSKVGPRVLYQDPGDDLASPKKDGWEVHTATINGRVYGFLGALGGPTRDGVWAYDMTRAQELNPPPNTRCVENLPSPNPSPNCIGIYKGRMWNEPVGHIDGAGDGTDYFVVASGGQPAGLPNDKWGFQIWKVNNVANGGPYPSVLTGHTTSRIDGVALWREGNRYLLALANRDQELGQIYNVTCIKNNNCGSLSSLLLYQFPLAGFNNDFTTIATVQDSSNNGAPWVYYGRRNVFGVMGLQNEWLFDVAGITASNPPAEITGGNPQNGNQGQPTMNAGGVTVGYWSYMYPCHPSGSNFLRPNGGVVYNNRFYRAGNSIFDIHRLRNVSPQIVVSGPSTGYVGQTLTFNAVANNCTPTPGGWSWTLTGTGGQVVGGGTSSSAQIQWSQVGPKTVSAMNSGCPGATVVAAAIQIADPAPAIGSVSASPANAPVCTPITFTGNNVTGQPPLTHTWTIEQGGNPVPDEGGSGNPFVWDTEGVSPGTYVGRLTVTGPGGSANKASQPVTLTALDPLPSPGFAINNDPPVFGAVQFHSNVPSATEWRWDFGDGTIFQTTDPNAGPNPVHTYTQIGTYDVTLQVRNCVETSFVTSSVLEVEITEISPLLINDFRAQCPFGVCAFGTGEAIGFFHDVEGNPDTYEYDWTNDGNDPFEVEQSSTGQVNTHTYPAAGSYRPKLRVKRGTESVTFTHVQTIQVSTGGPPPPPPPGPSVTISGPTSLNIGQQGNFSASASNCTPNPNGWSWSATGGATGSSTTNQITLSWTSTGTKVISVANSGCTGASDTHVVSITDPGGGPGPNPGPLTASFTASPEEPGVGQQVTFDASSSIGEPTGIGWDFGDGTTGIGEVVTHTYAQPGVYEVELEISKVIPGSGCMVFGQEICTDTATMDLTVGDGGDCVEDADTLCLLGGRFEVTAHWHNQRNGETGTAKVYTPFSGDRTGMFWFFRPDNVELIVKSLDATNPEIFPEPAFWFFYGGLSDVEYWIDVVDTVTGTPKQYHNVPGTICGVPDTGAFPQDPQTELPEGEPLTGGGAFGAVGAFGEDDATFDLGVITGAGSSGSCVPNGDNLCLLDGRFSVEVDWHDQHNNNDGVGHPIVGTDRTGYFWFFNSDNVELVTKFINGTSVNGHYWLLWGGLSDVQYTIRVTDTVTGTQKQWENPPGSFCGGAAANAFPAD